MLSYEHELHILRADGTLDEATSSRLIAMERRELVSLHSELRLAMWVAVTMLATAAGWYLAKHYERIGPAVLIAIVGALAGGAYFWAWKKRGTTAAEYAVLLGALLLSADVGFAESQYHFFGDHWNRHILILAVIHAVTAYRFDSRPVLSLAIAGLAAHFGVKARDDFSSDPGALLLSALLVAAWGLAHRRLSANRAFDRVFDHAAVWLAAAAALRWLDVDIRGAALFAGLAAVCLAYAFRFRSLAFAVYGVLCAVMALGYLLIERLDLDGTAVVLFLLVAAVVALRMLHARIREEPA